MFVVFAVGSAMSELPVFALEQPTMGTSRQVGYGSEKRGGGKGRPQFLGIEVNDTPTVTTVATPSRAAGSLSGARSVRCAPLRASLGVHRPCRLVLSLSLGQSSSTWAFSKLGGREVWRP